VRVRSTTRTRSGRRAAPHARFPCHLTFAATRRSARAIDRERYQTVYPGGRGDRAPTRTALHGEPSVFAPRPGIETAAADPARRPGTFQPVRAANVETPLEPEAFRLPPRRRPRRPPPRQGGRVVASARQWSASWRRARARTASRAGEAGAAPTSRRPPLPRRRRAAHQLSPAAHLTPRPVAAFADGSGSSRPTSRPSRAVSASTRTATHADPVRDALVRHPVDRPDLARGPDHDTARTIETPPSCRWAPRAP